MPLRSSPSGCCATVRTPVHSPTADAAVPLASVLPPPLPVSWHSFLLAPRASAPSAANHYLSQRLPKYSALPVPAVSVDTRPSLLMRICGSLSPEFLRPGCRPTKHPASRFLRKRCGSSMVSTVAMRSPTPFTCLSNAVSGYVCLAIFSIRRSYSWMRSFNDSTSRNSGSNASRNPVLNPLVVSRLNCWVPHLRGHYVGV